MTAQYAKRPLQVAQYVRNNKYPDAQLQSALHEAANQAAAFRTQEVCRFASPLAAIPGAAELVRWRARWHTSPFAKHLWCMAVLAPSSADNSPRVVITVKTAAHVVVGTMEFHFGNNAAATSDTPAYFSTQRSVLNDGAGNLVALPTDTTCYLEVKCWQARIVSLTAFETADPTLLDENYGAQSPLYDTDRAGVLVRLRELWKHAAHPLIRWSVESDDSPLTSTTTTNKNLLDTAISTVSTSSPGFTLDGRNRSTVRRFSVPCMLYCYGRTHENIGNPEGVLELVSAAGVVLGSLEIPVSIGANAWAEVAVNLPATLAKYDLRFRASVSGQDTVYLYAAGLYQYET